VAGSIAPMPENDDLDPAANTQMFQAFVDRAEPEESGRGKRIALAGAALAGLVVVVVLAWLVLG
jgi:hypothetical protein